MIKQRTPDMCRGFLIYAGYPAMRYFSNIIFFMLTNVFPPATGFASIR